MGCKHFLSVCATLLCFYAAATLAQGVGQRTNSRLTRFTCYGRPPGYYADVDTGCQVYHMCDGLGRQFSYTCPNTTLFQQRMLVCDHWYMVNCSMSEKDYGANLLIGQRDKPFVSDAEMQLRTPRPDILSVPPNSNYFDGLKEAESKYGAHPGNSIVGIPDSISSANNNGLDSDKQNYRPPTAWSTGRGRKTSNLDPNDDITGAASQRSAPTLRSTPEDSQFSPTIRSTPEESQFSPTIRSTQQDMQFSSTKENQFSPNFRSTPQDSQFSPTPRSAPQDSQISQTTIRTPTFTVPRVSPPSSNFLPPFPPTTESDITIDARTKEDDPVINFINRFDPNSPDSFKTAMTKTEILSINEQLPPGQSSAEEERTPRKQKNGGNDVNKVQNNEKGFVDNSRFESVNLKPAPTGETIASTDPAVNEIPTPGKELLPPKNDFSRQHLATTEGPAVYYEWKWAAPALDLEPPNQSNETVPASGQEKRNVSVQSPFSRVTRPPPVEMDAIPPTKNTEYNISSYFVPDYVFPLDKAHPGYEEENAETSFNVRVARPGRTIGENPACPHCHPAYLNPGTCEPCIAVKR